MAKTEAALQRFELIRFHLAFYHFRIFHLFLRLTLTSPVAAFFFSLTFFFFHYCFLSFPPFFIFTRQNTINPITPSLCLLSTPRPFPPLCEQQLEGDLETLALVTYSSLCVSMLALLLTVLVLSCLRGLKSNTRSIHSNTAAAMFLSELVFLLGVNQTEQQVGVVCLCRCCSACL